MSKDSLFDQSLFAEMVANKRGGIDPLMAFRSALETFAAEQFGLGAKVRWNEEEQKLFRCWEVVSDETDLNSLPDEIKINKIVLNEAKKAPSRTLMATWRNT